MFAIIFYACQCLCIVYKKKVCNAFLNNTYSLYQFVIPKYSILHFHSFLIWENNIDAQNVATHMDDVIQGINRGFANDELTPIVQFLIFLRPEPWMNSWDFNLHQL